VTSDEIGRMNTCVRACLLYSSVNSSYIDVNVLNICFLLRSPILNTYEKEEERKKRDNRCEKSMHVVDDDTQHH
jgi:hypothetical protein